MLTSSELLNGYKIYQYEDEFKFSYDAVALADFIEKIQGKKILEIGGGTGIIPILLVAKDKVVNSEITTLEIQEKMYNLIKKNIEINKCEKLIKVENIDVKEYKEGNRYDTIFSNPPYMTVDGKKQNENKGKLVSRHEVTLTLEELIVNCKRLLKPKGEFYLIHRTYRVQEIISLLDRYKFNIERIQFIYHDTEDNSNLVLIKANKGMRKIIKVEPPKYVTALMER